MAEFVASRERYDVIIIGGGIAGLSLAYFLSLRGVDRILLVEQESFAGYHATGRSAASLVELDSVPTLRELKMIGAEFLRRPPQDFTDQPLLDERGVLVLLTAEEARELQNDVAGLRQRGLNVHLMAPEQASSQVQGSLDTSQFASAAYLPNDGFIDVHQLLSCFQRQARSHGVELAFSTTVDEIPERDGRCLGVLLGGQLVRADYVVNAAGAWAGRIGNLAGATPVGLEARRRCILLFDAPAEFDIGRWPMLWSDAHHVYLREDAGRVLLCPMDEQPMDPCDAQWDEFELAAGIERMQTLLPRLQPRAIRHRWAGLRTFAPDRVPVVGFDPRRPGFFWLAGQGGCGIETCGALGQIAADLLTIGRSDRFETERLAVTRFT